MDTHPATEHHDDDETNEQLIKTFSPTNDDAIQEEIEHVS